MSEPKWTLDEFRDTAAGCCGDVLGTDREHVVEVLRSDGESGAGSESDSVALVRLDDGRVAVFSESSDYTGHG